MYWYNQHGLGLLFEAVTAAFQCVLSSLVLSPAMPSVSAQPQTLPLHHAVYHMMSE